MKTYSIDLNVPFLDIVDVQDLTHPSSELILDPIQLVPCGHRYTQTELEQWYFSKGEKICPIHTCKQPYILAKENSFIKKMICKFIEIINKTNQDLIAKIYTLYNILPDSEDKQQINQGIELFIKGKKEGVKMVGNVITSSINGSQYSSIFKLMKAHSDNISKELQSIRQKYFTTAGENGQIDSPFQNILFLDVVDINDLICPLLKIFMLDPVQLIHCGHHFSQAAIDNWYYEKYEKNCPIATCGQPYVVTLKDDFLERITNKFIEKISQPNSELTNEIHTLYQALPDSEDKEKIKQGIKLFIKGKREGIKIVGDVIMSSVKGKDYSSIFKLMKIYNDNIPNQISTLIQQKNDAKTTENSQIESVFTAIIVDDDTEAAEVADDFIFVLDKNSHAERYLKRKRGGQNFNDQDRTTTKYARLENDEEVAKDHSSQVFQANNENEHVMAILQEATNENSEANAISQENILFEAIKRNATRVITSYIQRVNVNDQDDQKRTALHLVVEKFFNPTTIIRGFYEAGGQLDIRDSNGETALHIAAKMNKIQIIQQLRNLGASTSIKNNQGKIPVDVAVSNATKNAFQKELKKPS